MLQSLCEDQAKLGEMPAQRIDHLCAPTDEAPVCAAGDSACLMLGAHRGDVLHVRPESCFGDGRGVGCFVLLPFDERLYIDRRARADFMAVRLGMALLEVAGSSGFHRDYAGSLLA